MAELAEHIIRQQSVSQEQTKQPKDVSRTLQPKADSKLQLSLHGKAGFTTTDPAEYMCACCYIAVKIGGAHRTSTDRGCLHSDRLY